MKRRFENLLAISLSLLISAVWIPTFWVLLQLPWTWDGEKPSAFLDYVDQGIGTVEYQITNPPKRQCTPDPCEPNYFDRFDKSALKTTVGESFGTFGLFTLLAMGLQYLLTGRISLRFKKDEAQDQDE